MNKSTVTDKMFFPFKSEQDSRTFIYPAVSIFDFYAIHAPDIPAEFTHTPPPNKPVHPGQFRHLFGTDSSYKHKSIVLHYHTDDSWVESYYKSVPEETRKEIEADIASWEAKYDAWKVEEPIWQRKNTFARYSQWQFAYATHMVETRDQWMDDYKYAMPPEQAEAIAPSTSEVVADILAPVSNPMVDIPESATHALDFSGKAIKCDTWGQMSSLAPEAKKQGFEPMAFTKISFNDSVCIYFVTSGKKYTNVNEIHCQERNLTIVPYNEFINHEPKG